MPAPSRTRGVRFQLKKLEFLLLHLGFTSLQTLPHAVNRPKQSSIHFFQELVNE